MVEGRIAFKLDESDEVGRWNDYLQIRLSKQQSRSITELKEIEIYARLKDGRVDGILRMFGKIPNEPSAFHHILCRLNKIRINKILRFITADSGISVKVGID